MDQSSARAVGADMGVRRFGRFNWMGLATLIERECRRFLSVWTQTLLAPLVTAGIFIGVFSIAIGGDRGEVMGVPFLNFLVPGILMMTVIQNAFANTSSSLGIAKVQGNIVDTLMPPLSAGEIVLGYLAGGVGRGLLVALAISLVFFPLLGIGVAHPLWALFFVVVGSTFLAALGMIAAILASRFDQMAAITNFVITPLSFLSGTFYSIERLPAGLEALSRLNPIFYLIDGARYGVIGASDSSPVLGAVVCLAVTGGSVYAVWWMVRTGYRLKP